MRSGGNSFNYFPQNKPIKLANLVQLNVCSCLSKDLIFVGGAEGAGPPASSPYLRHWDNDYNVDAMVL